jgi:hypothetical protein
LNESGLGFVRSQLAGGTGDDIGDAVHLGMLKVVLVAAQHQSHAGVLEQPDQRLHAIGVLVASPAENGGW